MDIFFTAIVLMAALVIGADDSQREDNVNPSNVAPAGDIELTESERPVQACDPYYPYTIQRDLSVPLKEQASDDKR